MTRPLIAALLTLALLPAVLLPAPAQAFQLPGFGNAQTPQEVHVEAFVAGLKAAIASGDARRVAPLFPAGGPAFAWLGQRWGEMRKGSLDPVAWDVGFERLYGDHERIGGLLTIAARDARGRVVSGRFEVEAVRRGRAWVVGDPLPLTRPDCAITRHDLRVDLRRDGELTAEDVLAIAPSGPDRRLFLRLDPNLVVSAASAGGQPAAFQQRGDLLFVELPASPLPFELTLAYAGPVAAGLADHVGPDDSLLRADRAWYPRPAGDPAPAVFRLMAMVRPGQRAIAPGAFGGVDRYEDGWLHHWTTPAAVPGIAVMAGTLAGAEVVVGKTNVAAFVRPGREPAAAGMVVEAARIIGFYGPRFGPYPYAKLALVEAGEDRGYGGGDAVALPAAAFEYQETADAIMAREIAHAWTGQVAYRGTPGERLFMAEGVAAYMDLLYHASRDGVPGFRSRLAAAQRRWSVVADSPLDVSLSRATAAGGEEALRALTLDKGAIVLNMLRRRIGPAAFEQGLKRFYGDHAGKLAGVPELRRAFEAGGPISLVAFFDQWLGRPGRPTITAEAVEVLPLPGGKYAIRGALVQAGKPWHLQVPLVVETTGQARVYEVDVRGELSAFELITSARPRTLLLDPLRDTLLAPAPDVDLGALLPTPKPAVRPKPAPPAKPAKPVKPSGY